MHHRHTPLPQLDEQLVAAQLALARCGKLMLRLRSAAESIAGKEATSGRRGEGGVNPLTGEKDAAFATAASTRKPSENAKHPSRLLLLLEALRATFVTLCSVPSLAPISALLEPAEATPEAPSADDALFNESAPSQQRGGAVALVERCLDKASPPQCLPICHT